MHYDLLSQSAKDYKGLNFVTPQTIATLEVCGFIKLQPFAISHTPFPFTFLRKTTKTGPIGKSHANIKIL